MPDYTVTMDQVNFGGSITDIAKYSVNTRPYWFKSINTETANAMSDTVANRVFYDETTGSLYQKVGLVTYSDSLGSPPPVPAPSLKVCTSPIDDLAATASNLLIDVDVSNLPFHIL